VKHRKWQYCRCRCRFRGSDTVRPRRFGRTAILWFIPGVLLAIGYAMSGVLLCITIIGIPFGVQAFKFIPLALSPFDKEVVAIDSLRAR
jgi:uncharacterized membrane protein YccF (DUF307 family)